MSMIKLSNQKSKETKRLLNDKIASLQEQLHKKDTELNEKWYELRRAED